MTSLNLLLVPYLLASVRKEKQTASIRHSQLKHLNTAHALHGASWDTSHALHTLGPWSRSSCVIPPCAIILALSASWKLSFNPAAALDVVLIRIGLLSPTELLTSVLSFSGLNGLLIGVIAPWAEPNWSPALLMNHWSNERMWGRGDEKEEGRPPGGGRACTSEIRSGFQLSLNRPYLDS